MSQSQTQAAQAAMPYPPYVMVPVRESNGLGVAGFFIALFGLFIPTGILALLGLLVSLVALGKAPRGFASMGVLIGLLGTVFWMVIMAVVVLGGLAGGAVVLLAVAAMFVITQPEVIEVTSDMINVTLAAVEYEEDNGSLPRDLGVLGLSVSALTDPWGNPYRYELIDNDPGFDVISDGGDGTPGTTDDMALSRIDRIWQDACANFGAKMEEFGERMEALDGRNFRIDGHSYGPKLHVEKPADAASHYEAAARAAAIAEALAYEAAEATRGEAHKEAHADHSEDADASEEASDEPGDNG